jgi:hypothetical protein
MGMLRNTLRGRLWEQTREKSMMEGKLAMTRRSTTIVRFLRISVCVILGMSAAAACRGQGAKVTQVAGVDNTRLGAYRALAQLTFQAFQRGDDANAAELARILERTWDQGEWHNTSDGSVCKPNRALCQPIDRALDVFIKPVINYTEKKPDPTTVQAAYTDFLNQIKKAE